MRVKNNSKALALLALSASLVATNGVLAENVASNGGLKINSADGQYWFSVGGVLKLEQRNFFGNKQSRGKEFYSGGRIRDLGLDFKGGIGKDISYSLGFSYDPSDSKVNVDNAFVSYKGWGENLEFSVGQLFHGFCLESANSSKWIPFLERSMAASAFAPCPGIGVSVNKWDQNYSFVMAITQPKHGNEAKDPNDPTKKLKASDKWESSARFAFRPFYEENKLIQIGLSGHIKNDGKAAIKFSAAPEAKARNMTNVLDTGYITAKNHYALDLELSAQNGPLYAEAEYQLAKVKKVAAASANNKNKFSGYNVKAAYVLTGESRCFNKKNATFGQVKPSSDKGAWEIAARYSFINLNDKDIQGGKGRNITTAVNYYLNNNIRVSGEYTLANLTPSKQVTLDNQNKRKLHIVGLRLQAVF